MLLVTITSRPSGRRRSPCGGVDEHVAALDLRISFATSSKIRCQDRALGHDVRLVADHHLAARLATAYSKAASRMRSTPLPAWIPPDGDLVAQPFLKLRRRRRRPLGSRGRPRSRCPSPRGLQGAALVVELHGPQVDVEVEPEAGAEEHVGGGFMSGTRGSPKAPIRMASSCRGNRRAPLGEGLAGRQVAVGVPVETDQLQRESQARRGLEGLPRVGGHVLARAVAGHPRDVLRPAFRGRDRVHAAMLDQACCRSGWVRSPLGR